MQRVSMQRVLFALLVSFVFLGIVQEAQAQRIVDVSGYLLAGQTRTFYSRTPGNTQTDTIYRISGNYSITGRLVIQEGAEVHFVPGGRIIDSVGGKIIANGFTGNFRRIQFRGLNINNNSYEWGHILVLPGADSVFFANCRFAFFRKKESIDMYLLYGTADVPGNPMLTNSLALLRASNGSGGVMCTFSARTYLYDVQVDSCQAIYRGGAFAFLQAPANSYFPGDDGRMALVNRQVRKLLVRDTRVFNETTTPNSHANWADTGAYGGAIYAGARLGSTTSDWRLARLGYADSAGLGFPGNLDKAVDSNQFERCTVNNPNDSVMTPPTPGPSQVLYEQQSYGGAIYMGPYTGLEASLLGCNSDSAIAASGDAYMRGGAIYMHATDANPSLASLPQNSTLTEVNMLPGLKIYKRARFLGNVAGMGGAIYMEWQNNGTLFTNGPSLMIDGDNIVQNSPSVIRDSGLIDFTSNTAYWAGGAIYQNWYTNIKGYLAPQTHVLPRWDSVELRTRFINNCAGIAGGSIYLNPNANPDITSRRVWHQANFVNPNDLRINRPQYTNLVLGGGAEFLGTRDSVFAVEYHDNYVIGGNGGAVYINSQQSGPGIFAYNRFMVEDKYWAQNPAYLNFIQSITPLTVGSGYVSAPTVIISGGGGTGATATANISAGAVVSYTITNPGRGYISNPTVTVIGGGGSGATASATATNLAPPMPFDPRELTRFCDNMANLVASDSIATENRNGRGGALYVVVNNGNNPLVVLDTLILSRTRFERNQGFTGSAIYSDNFRLQLTANQTLIANNFATSRHSAIVDLENPNKNNPGDANAGATLWADFEGPAPQYESNSRGNAIYDNRARYILREPDGPHGFGGVDTLRGNFWGDTGPDVITQLPTLPIGAIQGTFFIDFFDTCTSASRNVYEPNRWPPAAYSYIPIGTIPDTLLMEGRIYDIFDRGLDIKTVDYSNRRLAIAEAFSLGLPTDIGLASKNRTGIHRWTRDIFTKDPVYLNKILRYQVEFVGPHPIGYPLFLTADIDSNDFNRDHCARNFTTLFVLNETTQEYVRVNLKEEFDDKTGPQRPLNEGASIPYLGRLDFVPDSTAASRHPNQRARVFWSPTLIRPANTTYQEIARAAKLEDSAALDGRQYNLDASQLQNEVGPNSVPVYGPNYAPPATQTTWYAGERYHTLPVRPGDNIVVFSRTQLWKYGYAGARARGLSFVIGDVLPPLFSGDVPALASDTVNPNRLFLREDNNYVKYSQGQNPNDVLFRIGGYDRNQFYDPRWLFDEYYTQLDFAVSFGNGMDSVNYRLPWWVGRDTVRNVNPTTGSNGYIQLFGHPQNPDVVPGGEPVHVVMTNFPPNKYSEHLLLDSMQHAFNPVLGPDSLKLSMWIYPRYMNCTEGFLPDTIDIRRTASVYDFRIFVRDSLPIFTSTPNTGCDGIANLTDRLRFDYDLQTDDETEDSTVAINTYLARWPASIDSVTTPGVFDTTWNERAWDFRYGRTTYAGLIVPLWLKGAVAAPVFKTKGILHVDIDSVTAYNMLTPVPQVNGELLLDTIVSLEADDGHAGKRTQQWRAQINVEPRIITDALPNAKEDFDYSRDYHDTTVINRIIVTDPNFSDTHTFRLLYEGDQEVIFRDNRYKTGGDTVRGHSPRWLSINPASGVLSGVPGVNDAPRLAGLCDGPNTVTVVVEDQCGLTAWKQLNLNVDSTQHLPKFLRGPKVICITNKVQFCDSIVVTDHDLLRDSCAAEELLFTVILPDSTTWTVTPNKIKGPLNSDTTSINVCGTFNLDDTYFGQNPLPQKFIEVAVDDQHGNHDTLKYEVIIGDVPTFECAVTVSNLVTPSHPKQDLQRLCFGAGRFGTDSLDIRYCEFEVPSAPNGAAFDGRWELPVGGSLKGTYIDIRKDTAQFSVVAWQIRFNSGSDDGGFYYPIRICWNKSCFDNTGTFSGNFYLQHPFDPQEFSINMKGLGGPINATNYTLLTSVGGKPDSVCLEIRNVGLSNARIVFVPTKSGVVENGKPVFSLEPNYPNPFSSSTTLRFNVASRSNVKIEVFDIKGTLVRTLVNESLESSATGYPAVWDGLDASGNEVSAGTYIAKMTAGDFTTTVKMTLNK